MFGVRFLNHTLFIFDPRLVYIAIILSFLSFDLENKTELKYSVMQAHLHTPNWEQVCN